jgi:AcrR family transcriptional regulator
LTQTLSPPADGRGAARRRAFLAAAREVFLRDGYEAASVTDVVRIAGGSLATLYGQFGSKEGLFLAMAQERQKHFLDAMTPERVDHLPLELGLKAIGEHFLRALLAPDAVAMFRIVLGEGRNLPEDLRRFFFSGADKVRAVASAYLIARVPAMEDPDTSAGYFLELVRSRNHFRALTEPDFTLSDAEIRAHVADVVRFFLKGVRTGA